MSDDHKSLKRLSESPKRVDQRTTAIHCMGVEPGRVLIIGAYFYIVDHPFKACYRSSLDKGKLYQ